MHDSPPTAPHRFLSPTSTRRLRAAALGFALVAFFASCDDSGTSPAPAPSVVDTTKQDTTKIDSNQVTGPVGSDSLRPGQALKTIQLRGHTGFGKSATWVSFAGTNGHTYTFTCLPRGKGTAQVFRLSGTDTLAQVANPLVGDSVVFPCLRAGIYLVKVIGPSGTKVDLKVGENSLIPMYFEGADNWEPDNDTAHASDWDFKTMNSQRRTTHYAGSVDTDMIRLRLDSGSSVTISVNGTSILPSLGRPQVKLLGADGSELSLNSKFDGTWTYACFRARTAYLQLVGESSTNPYTVSLASKSGLPATAVLPDAWEPDSSLAQAPLLTLDTAGITRNFHGDITTDDVDLFRIHADSGSVYSVQVEAKTAPIPSVISWQGVHQVLIDSGYIDSKTRIWKFGCIRTGEYQVRLQGSQAETYRIRMRTTVGLPDFLSLPDSLEPDDTRSKAVVLGHENTTFHRTLPDGDVDWFSMQLDSGMAWVLYLEGQGTSGEIFNADSVQLVSLGTMYSSTRATNFLSRKSGKYYLRLHGPSDQKSSANISYSISSEAGRNTDPWESDDSAAIAHPLPADGNWVHRSLRGGDFDWMTIRVPAGNRLRVWINLDDPLMSTLYSVFGGAKLQQYTDLGSGLGGFRLQDSFEIYTVRDTVVYLQVLAATDLTTPDAPYRVRATMAPVVPDSLEPDQTRETAHRMALDSHWVSRNLFPGDQDWMSFDVPSGKVVHFEASTPGTFSDDYMPFAKIYWPDGSRHHTYWNGAQITEYVPHQGPFYLQFAADANARDVVNYSFRVWTEDYQDSYEPDNTIDQAKTLPLDSSLQTRLLWANDSADWIRIPGAGHSFRYLQLLGNDGYRPTFTLHRADGSLIASVEGSSNLNDPPILVARSDDTSTVFVRMDGSASVTSYTTRGWKVWDCDSLEPDGGISKAVKIPYDSLARRRFVIAQDEDWMEFSPTPGKLRVLEVVVPLSSNRPQWEVRKRDSTLAFDARNCQISVPGGNISYQLTLGDMGDTNTYFLRVLSASNGAGATYTVRGWSMSDPDRYESSDDRTHAPMLGVVPITRWINRGDSDLFRLHMEPNQAVKIVSSGDVTWRLEKAAGMACTGCMIGGLNIQSDIPADYVVVVHPDRDLPTFQPYTLQLVMVPFDSSSRHRTRATAILVPSDGTLFRGSTSYTDTIWYRVHLVPNGNIFVRASSVGQKLALFTQDSIRELDALDLLEEGYLSGNDTSVYLGVAPRTDTVKLSTVEISASSRTLDRYEPDNRLSRAGSIDSGEVQERTMAVGDTDIIQLPAKPAVSGKYRHYTLSGRACMATEVIDSTGQPLGYNDYFYGGSRTDLFTPIGPLYFIRLIGITCFQNPHQGGGRYTIDFRGN